MVNLTLRELRSRYKRSVLGWTWSLLNPLATVAIFTMVFKFFLKAQIPPGRPSGLSNFAAYLLAGLLPWNYFNNTINGSMSTLVAASGLIKKVYFPRENLVFATVFSLLASFLIELGVLAVILLILGNAIWVWIPVVLLLVVIETVFVIGLGLMLSIFNAYFRDVQYLVGSILLQVLFYLTPIVYSVEGQVYPRLTSPFWRKAYTSNPMMRFVDAFHKVLYDLRWPSAFTFVYLIASSLASLALGLWVFNRFEGRLAEEL